MTSTKYQLGSIEVVQLDERLTLDEVDLVRPLLHQSIQNRLPQVIVDVRRLLLIDSAGLELLIDSAGQCARRGGRLRLSGASALLQDVLRITGLDQQLELDSDVVSAAGAFAR